jgi:hypothetical protein
MRSEDLLAYVDGELDPATRERVEQDLLLHPEWLEVLSSFYRQRMLLAEAYREATFDESAPTQPIPVGALSTAAPTEPAVATVSLRRRAFGWGVFAAAACVAVAVGIWLFRADPSPRDAVKTVAGELPKTTSFTPLRDLDSSLTPAPPLRDGPRDDSTEPVLPRPPELAPSRPIKIPGAPPSTPPTAGPFVGTPVTGPGADVPDDKKRQTSPPLPANAAQTPPKLVPPLPPTEVALACVDSLRGKVQLCRGIEKKLRFFAKKGTPLFPDDMLDVPAEGSVVVRYPDGTQFEAGPWTLLMVATHGGDSGPGPDGVPRAKKVVLYGGGIYGDVRCQPEGLPMVLTTPQAIVHVVGTRFALTAEGPSTRLELFAGKVRLTRRVDGATVNVSSGQCVVALPESPLEVRSLRSAKGLVALYHFNEGQGNVVRDISGVGDPLNLRIANPKAVSWVPGGLMVHAPTTVASDIMGLKISQACKRSLELTVEAWIRPLEDWTEGGHLVSLASSPHNLSVVIDKEKGVSAPVDVRLKTHKTYESGALMRGGPITSKLTHVVYSRNASGQGALYLNGERLGEHVVAGNFDNWDDNCRIAVAGDAKGKGPWRGEFYFLAVYSRALSPSEVVQNFRAGSE